MDKLNWIDALRGYAILGVIFVHGLLEEKGIFLSKVWALGHKGVQLFFVISAFTLMLSYYRRKEERFDQINFFIRRYFRIAPMFYLALIYYLVQDRNLPYPESYYQNASISNIIAHVFLVTGISPHWINSIVYGGWSVGVEVMFYLLCPFLFVMIRNVKTAIYFYVITLLVGLGLYFFLLNHPLISDHYKWELFLYYYLPSQMFVFMIGFIAYFTCKVSAKKACTYIAIMIAITLFCYILSYLLKTENYKLLNNNSIGILFLILINVLSRKSYPIIVNRPIMFVGKVSYSVYLIHFAAIYLLKVWNLTNLTSDQTVSFFIRVVLILVISLPLAFITYQLVEIPFQNIGKKIINRRKLVTT